MLIQIKYSSSYAKVILLTIQIIEYTKKMIERQMDVTGSFKISIELNVYIFLLIAKQTELFVFELFYENLYIIDKVPHLNCEMFN